MLTELQQKFLDNLFDDEFLGNARAAATAAGYSENTALNAILDGVKDEIQPYIDKYLTLHAPESIKSMLNVLRNPGQNGGRVRLDAAAMILDRAGFSKKERVEVSVKASNALLILPAKEE